MPTPFPGTKRCASCRYFVADEASKMTGQCRRHPPQTTVSPAHEDSGGHHSAVFVAVFPDVEVDEWCGDHRQVVPVSERRPGRPRAVPPPDLRPVIEWLRREAPDEAHGVTAQEVALLMPKGTELWQTLHNLQMAGVIDVTRVTGGQLRYYAPPMKIPTAAPSPVREMTVE